RVAEPAERPAGERDAQLRRGDRVVEALDELAHRERPKAPLVDELLDTCPPYLDDRELGGDEEAVERHEQWHAEQSQQVDGDVVHGRDRGGAVTRPRGVPPVRVPA